MAITSLFVLCLWASSPSPSQFPLRVALVFEGPKLPAHTEAAAVREAALIWKRYEVDIQLAAAGDADDAIRLTVRLADRPDQDIPPNALGIILFVRDQPEPAIVLYPGRVAALLERTPSNTLGGMKSSPLFVELALGRALGRALAHEIGHYVLRSRAHSDEGLMRVTQRSWDLVTPSRRGLGLSVDEEQQLESTRAASLALCAAER
jgi:hypothetical protein